MKNLSAKLKIQEKEEQEGQDCQTKGNSNSGIYIDNIELFIHERLLKNIPITKHNIPNSKSTVNIAHFFLPFTEVKLGTIKTTPNQPADRLINRSDNPPNQFPSNYVIASVAKQSLEIATATS